MSTAISRRVVWRPQEGPQKALVDCSLPEIFFGGARGGGKCLPLTEPVLTPFGWRQLGDIKVGQSVCNPNGTVSKVIAVYMPGKAQVWEVTFSDGAKAFCDDGHIWLGRWVGHRNKRGLQNKLWRFSEIRRKFDTDKLGRFLIPLTSPVVFTRPKKTKHGDSRPVDPYLLGILLGDGSMTGDSIRYSTCDNEIDAFMAGHGTVRVDEGPNRRLVNAPGIKDGLKKIGAWGCRAETKRVPVSYMWATISERLAVLQGLLDTDGTVDARGHVYFCSVSEGLADDAVFLARSLGYKASKWVKKTTHLDAHNVYIQGSEKERLFRLSRKSALAAKMSGKGTHARRIVSIKDAGIHEVGCFQVDDPNGLFITRDFVVTHNTDGVLGKWALKESRHGKNFNAMMFRPTTTSSEDAIERSHEIYGPLGGRFNSQKLIWRMPNGGRVGFGYLRTVDDAKNVQGRNLTDAWVEEIGQQPDPAPVDMLFGALRSRTVPVQLIGTGNPGGPGQGWISKRYGLIPLPQKPTIVKRTLPNGAIHKAAVIPSRLTDNKLLLSGDPGYVSRLYLSGSQGLVDAWLNGNWAAVEGAYFDCWSERMIVQPFAIPAHWTRFRSYDWGSASPFSVGWWAVADGSMGGFPKGALIRYREWYGGEGVRGFKMTNQDQARGILEREAQGERIDFSVADPSIWAERGGPSIAEDFAKEGVFFTPGDNSRLAGWAQMRQRMTGDDGVPMIYVFSTCVDSIRTIPTLPHSMHQPEDLDTSAEDHAADDWRYACMARPWVAHSPAQAAKRDRWARSFSEDGCGSWRI